MAGVPTLVVEMGVGMRITESYCMQLTDGIFCLMKDLGIWDGETVKPREPVVSLDGRVELLNAERAGIFVPKAGARQPNQEGRSAGRYCEPPRRNGGGNLLCSLQRPCVYTESLPGGGDRAP